MTENYCIYCWPFISRLVQQFFLFSLSFFRFLFLPRFEPRKGLILSKAVMLSPRRYIQRENLLRFEMEGAGYERFTGRACSAHYLKNIVHHKHNRSVRARTALVTSRTGPSRDHTRLETQPSLPDGAREMTGPAKETGMPGSGMNFDLNHSSCLMKMVMYNSVNDNCLEM